MEGPQEAEHNNEKFDYASFTLFPTVIHTRNSILHRVLLISTLIKQYSINGTFNDQMLPSEGPQLSSLV